MHPAKKQRMIILSKIALIHIFAWRLDCSERKKSIELESSIYNPYSNIFMSTAYLYNRPLIPSLPL